MEGHTSLSTALVIDQIVKMHVILTEERKWRNRNIHIGLLNLPDVSITFNQVDGLDLTAIVSN